MKRIFTAIAICCMACILATSPSALYVAEVPTSTVWPYGYDKDVTGNPSTHGTAEEAIVSEQVNRALIDSNKNSHTHFFLNVEYPEEQNDIIKTVIPKMGDIGPSADQLFPIALASGILFICSAFVSAKLKKES